MVLTTSHTISKSKTDEEKFDETTENLRDSEYFTEYTVSKHDRFHHKPRRQEMGRTTTRKTEEKKALAMAMTPIAAKKKNSFFSSEKLLNIFKKKKYKTPTKSTEKRKENELTTVQTIPVEISELTTNSRRCKRKQKKNFNLEMKKRYVKSYKTLFSTKGKLPPISSKEFPNYSGLEHQFHLPTNDVTLAYVPSFSTDTPSTGILSEEQSHEFMGTAELENMLAQIKEKAILTIASQPSPISEIITSTVTETTFEADPILRHYFPRSSTLKNPFSYYMKQKRSLNSTVAAMETRNDGNTLKSNVASSSCSFEDQLEKEIKELLQIIKRKICCGLKCAKSTTKGIINDAKVVIHKATAPKKNKNKHAKANMLSVCSCKETNSSTRNSRNGTTKRNRLFRHRKTTNNVEDKRTLPVDDDYSMLKGFEHVLSKSHEDNVMKMATTPHNVFSYKRNVNKVSKRNQETIEDLNLKENIRKLVDFDPIPDEPDYNKDTSFVSPRKEDYDPKIEAITIDSSSSDTTSLEGLSKRLSYKEYVDGFKNYLNYVRDTTSSNFSNLVRYQAHRHHKVEDIGKFILDKIPNAVPQMRNKRRFFDDSDGDDQDMSTKNDESWFKRHFYLFIETGPPKKYHTTHTVSSKHASGTTRHKRGKKFPVTAVNEITTEETKAKTDGDINEILKFLDYTIHSLATLQVNGRLYFLFLRCNKDRSYCS